MNVSSTSVARHPDAPQRAGISWLRLLAAFGIVTFHLHLPGEHIGYAGLPVFTMLMAAMAVRSARGRSWQEYCRGRWRRLLLPWLVWSAFYVAPQCYMAQLVGAPMWSWWQWNMLLIGTYAHLWFLPFAAIASMAIGRALAGRGAHAAQGSLRMWGAVGCASLVGAEWLLQWEWPMPLAQWLVVLPGVFFGMAVATVPLGARDGVRPLACLALTIALFCAVLAVAGLQATVVQYVIAAPLVAVAWTLPWFAGRWATAVTATAFGVYLFHPFVHMGIAWLVMTTGWQVSTPVGFAGVIGGSMAMAAALRCTRLRAFL